MRKDDTQQCIYNGPKTLPITATKSTESIKSVEIINKAYYLNGFITVYLDLLCLCEKFGLQIMVIKTGDYMHRSIAKISANFSQWDSREKQANMLLIGSLKSIVTLKV